MIKLNSIGGKKQYQLYPHLVFILVSRPMKMPKIQIMCLFIMYKPQTVLSILAFI